MATIFGTSALYGISGAVTLANIQSRSLTRTNRLTSETINDSGQLVGERVDDWQETGTVTIELKTGWVNADFDVVDRIVMPNTMGVTTTYRITDHALEESNTANKRVTLSVRASENLTLT